ncbi:hypothetical protein OJAV_G00212430 [Oryzias javanicus]|uniref:Uncharacterized protein n=1 Tax=Oryzias javanicus TaxID=123683 RepID=A0A437C353_ORYJA|nr:hypothetical protein OJAV_G00212430 [Oryzias javanicus]
MEELCKAVLTAGGGVVVFRLRKVKEKNKHEKDICLKQILFLAGAVGFSWSGITLTFATGSVLGNMISSICNQTGTP